MENNEVMEIMETEVNAENEEVLETVAETVPEETVDTGTETTSGRYAWGIETGDLAKKFIVAGVAGIGYYVGVSIANEIIIPVAKTVGKKVVQKTTAWVKSLFNKNKTEEPAEEEVVNETEAPKETKKKAEKK